MKLRTRSKFTYFALASMSLGALSLAQGSSNQYDYDSRQNSRQNQQSGWMQGQGQSFSQQMEPEWVAIAFDFDNDGTYDVFEYIHSFDLENARSRSQARSQGQASSRSQQATRQQQLGFQQQSGSQRPSWQQQQSNPPQQGWQQQGWQQPGSQHMQTQRAGSQPAWMNQQSDQSMQRNSGQARQGRSEFNRVANTSSAPKMRAQDARASGRSSNKPAVYRTEGSLQSLEPINLVGMDEAHMLATLETDEGRQARVDLGPRSSVPTERLRRGGDIEVIGTIGKIDDRALLIADRIRVGNETFGVEREDDQDLTKFAGKIQSIRRVKYRGMDEKFVQAKVELQQGRTTIVDLGPESKHENVSLNKGDRVSFLADSVRIGGKPALRAEQVSLPNGTTLKLDRSWERKAYKKNGSKTNW